METLKFLKEYAHYIEINANDTFYYASADTTSVDVWDLWKAVEVESLYGAAGVIAFQAKIRDEEPLETWQTEKYKQAKEYLKSWVPHVDALRCK